MENFRAVILEDLTNVDLPKILDESLVLIIKNLNFKSPEEFSEFASTFGEIAHQYHREKKNAIEMGDEGASLNAHSYISWHNDGGFLRTPFSYVSLFINSVGTGASGTFWNDMVQAYEDLDEDFKAEIENVEALHTIAAHVRTHSEYDDGPYIHDFASERDARIKMKRGQAKHNLVRTTNGVKHLFFSNYVEEDSIGTDLYNRLKEHCYADKYKFEYGWAENDFVIFDNYKTVHGRNRTDLKIRRKLWKLQIK